VGVIASARDWLLASDEPGIVMQTKRDLLDDPAPAEIAHVLDGPKVRALLAGQRAGGGFGVNVYAKWQGGSNIEAVDWGTGPSELVTLNALRVLRAAGRPLP
jgi:hypothetical protein